MNLNIALFGQAERGSFDTFIPINTIEQLSTTLGNPPEDSLGIGLAVQTLLFRNHVYFIRVQEEGYSSKEYHMGLKLLLENTNVPIHAVCMPGVGNKEILDRATKICKARLALLLINDRDFYDFLTA